MFNSFFLIVILGYIVSIIYCYRFVNVKIKSKNINKLFSIVTNEYQSIPIEKLRENVVDTKVSTTLNFTLTNKYYGLRHGESEANVMKIISSNYEIGTRNHNLTSLGQTQSIQSSVDIINLIKKENMSLDDVIFISSPFLRAYYTAMFSSQAVSEYFTDNNGNQDYKFDIIVDDSLRERYFGEFDGLDLLYYNRVWAVDIIDGTNKRHNVESIQEVTDRIFELIKRLESKYSNKTIILVSHGDTLQITHMFLSKSDSRLFSLFRIKNGEVRDLSQINYNDSVQIKYI